MYAFTPSNQSVAAGNRNIVKASSPDKSKPVRYHVKRHAVASVLTGESCPWHEGTYYYLQMLIH